MNGITKLLHSDFRTYFDVVDLFTCRVRILIVTDGTGGFGDTQGFHLGQILKILADDPWSHVQFVVTKAHRQASSETGVLPNFRFNTHDLSQYDQIWLFGVERTSAALSPQELKALAQFMDGGGGVFATGDHENLGQAMCADVPRVRSMRRWYHNGSGPAGEPEAPDQTGPGRHDTLVDPAGSPLPNQSDAVPQRIRPRFYTRSLGGGLIQRVFRYPHPVLCGPAGVIQYLPDHMHEGLCEVPTNLARSFTFDGYTTTEYPTAGHQQIPEVIAWADSHGTTTTEFGVLAAYDGHRVNVGRVVVDATWHHWFNVNLLGFVEATDPLSPAYDPSVVPQWEAIKAYFRNVGLWLARPGKQNCLRNGGLLIATRYYDILITHRELSRVKDTVLYYWQLGVFARDALGRLAPQCQTVRWIIELIRWIEIPLDPWEQRPPRPRPDPWPPWLDLEQLELVALGGAVDALLTTFGKELEDEKGLQATVDRREKDVDQVAQRGAARAVSSLVKRSQEGFDVLKRLGERAERLNDTRPNPRD
jgi:hypothetical protein